MGAFAPSLPATMRPTAPMFPRSTRRSSILSQPSGRRSEPLVKNATVVLGRVDGFGPNKGASEGNEGREVLRGFLAAQRDPLEALERADGLLDAGTGFVESAREEFRLGDGISAVRNNGADAAPACCLAVSLAV